REAQLKHKNYPEHPAPDVLLFLIENAPLERWKRDILSMIREEAYYFLPQMQTKIMNEGWASYWHSTIMTQKALRPSEFIDYADHHAGTLASHPGRLNPYKIGIELFRDIEDRWNKGKFGKEYDECDDLVERKRWNRNLGLGRQKIFEVRRIFSDLNFIDTFLTQDFCRDHRLFVYAYNDAKNQYEISSREFKLIKDKLLYSLTNRVQPFISVTNANYQNRGELYLFHRHDGVDLRHDYAQETLANLFKIWHRPVVIETKMDGVEKLFYYDGKNHQEIKKTAQV
ncbi:MAG: SpoVR family protein, partial [Candidatus Binatia bacterium]